MSSTIVFDILARDRASDKFDKIGDSASRSSGKLKKFAVVGAGAVAAGAVIAGKALFDMTKAAMEDEKSQAMLAKALQNSAGATKGQVAATEEWITKQGKALGVADDELRPALAKLAVATGDVGKAQKLTSLAMDVSVGTGKNLQTVTEALQKAQNGSLGGLSRLGVATKNADGSTKSLAQVTKELAELHGGQAAAAAETAQGKFGRLKLMFDETKESIGAKLIPVAEKLADWFLREGVPAVQKFGEWFQQKIMPPLREFASSMAPKARAVMDALKGAFEDARPFIELVGKVLTNVVLPALKKLLEFAAGALVEKIKLIGKALEGIGKAGTWMWNNALQPVFKFLAKGIAVALDGFSALLGALGDVPGFGWAEKAAEAMGRAAEKARAVADGIKKIPNKTVTVTVAYKYTGRKNGVGSTRSDDPNDPSSYLPRMAGGRGGVLTVQQAASRFFDAISEGIRKGGKKVDGVLDKARERMRDKLSGIRDDMRSLSESVASALNQVDFGGTLQEHMASLTGTNGALSNLMAVFEQLKNSVSKDYLSALMQSGNIGLATALAQDPAAAAQASALFDANAAIAKGLGDQTATTVLGDRLEKALTDEIGKVVRELKDNPEKLAKKIARELENLRLEVTGVSPGHRAYVRGAR